MNNTKLLIYKKSREIELANRSYLFLFLITLWEIKNNLSYKNKNNVLIYKLR